RRERYRSNRNRRLAGELFRPTGKIERAAVEFRLPEAARGAMEDIDAGIRQRPQETFQLSRGRGELRVIVGDFPLREPQADGKPRSHPLAHFADNLRGETRPRYQIAAITVGPAIRFFPKELIDEVAVRSVQF